MSELLYSLREKLARSERYRESFVASVVKRFLPMQIRVLRKQRGWSQAELAKKSELTQGVISRAEDPDYGNLTLNTLVRIAAGFDCAFIARFVPFSELGRWYSALEHEKALEVQSFNVDPGFIERKPVARDRESDQTGHHVALPVAAGTNSLIPFGGENAADHTTGPRPRNSTGNLLYFPSARAQENIRVS